MSSNSNPSTVLPIQYLRGIAAMMVVWHHTQTQISPFKAFLPGEFGATGVDIFFVISGFIMLITTSGKAIGPLEFMARRIVRVVPMYWLLTIAMVLIWLVIPSIFKTLTVTPTSLAKSLLFIPYYSDSFPDSLFPLLVPGWTLNYEMFFYLLFALSLFFAPPTGLVMLTVVIIFLVFIGEALGPLTGPFPVFYTNPVLLEFVIGVLIAKNWLRHFVHINNSYSLAIFTAGWLMLICSSVLELGKYFTILGATCIVLGSLHSKYFSIRLRWLESIGDATYSIYLTHIFTLGIVRLLWIRLIGDHGSNINAYTFAIFSLLFCILIGVWSYFYIERPMTRFLTSKLQFSKLSSPVFLSK